MPIIENVLGVTQSPIIAGLGSYALRMEAVLGKQNILSIVMDKKFKNSSFVGNVEYGFFPPFTSGWTINLHLARKIIIKHAQNKKLIHYFNPLFLMINDSQYPQTVTIHDTYYKYYNNKTIARLTRRFRHLDRIIAISNGTKTSLVSDGFDEGRISVIYHYIPDIFKPLKSDRTLRNEKKIVLTIGDGPHKNNSLISKALNGKYHHIHVGHEEVGIENFENLSIEEMVALYNEAHVFVRMSSMEGFGFPVLESLFCGTPVVTTELPIFHEIVGEAGVFAKLNEESILSSVDYAIDNRNYLLSRFRDIRARYTYETFKQNMSKFYSGKT